MIPTNTQLTLLREKPHNTKLYLSIYQPTTVLSAQVNDASIAKGARSITFDTVTAGSYSLIQSGMTLYVGSSAGAFDKGAIRVKSATSSVLTVAENSHIDWADDDYLTVVNFYEINPIYPRIIQDPSDPTQTLWYKDYDVAYTNQNTVLGSFINMGPHHAGFIEEGSCQVYYSASGTYNLRGDTLSYHWFFEGATITGSNSHTPGNISYTTPGHYTTRLIVSGSSTGAVDTSYRHVSIYNRPESGANTPILDWELVSMSGSRDQGGYTAKVRLHETVSPTTLKDGSLVVIFSEDWYAGQKTSIGGNALGRSSVVFVGYIIKGSVEYNYRSSSVEFDVGSPTEIMKLANGFAVSVQYSDDPSTATSDPNIPSGWVAVLGMTVQIAIYHYLRYHSTVLMTNDFEFIGQDRYIQYFDTDRTSLFDAIQTAMKGILTGAVVCDRQGKIWAERDIYVQPLVYDTTFSLSNQDWINEIGIEENRVPRTSFIEMGGIYFSGPGGTYQPLLSNAPGNAPNYRGTVERIQGLALLNQAELNTIVGRVYAQRNITYPSVDIELAGNYRNFDIAPQEFIPLTVAATDTVRGISFTNKSFYLNRMEYKYDPGTELFVPRISLIEVATGVDGDTITIPAVPDDNGYTVPTIEVPQIVIPALPIAETQIVTGSGEGFPSYIPLTCARVNGITEYPTYLETDDIDDPGPGVRLVSGDTGVINFAFTFPPTQTKRVSLKLLFYSRVSSGSAGFYISCSAFASLVEGDNPLGGDFISISPIDTISLSSFYHPLWGLSGYDNYARTYDGGYFSMDLNGAYAANIIRVRYTISSLSDVEMWIKGLSMDWTDI